MDEDGIRGAVTESAASALITLDSVDAASVRVQHGLAQTSKDSELAYLIDADYYTELRREREAVLDILDHFRAEAGNLFRWAISPATERCPRASGRENRIQSPDTGTWGFEASYTTPTYRFNFTSSDAELSAVKRAIGGAIIAALPETGLDEVLASLRDYYLFYSRIRNWRRSEEAWR